MKGEGPAVRQRLTTGVAVGILHLAAIYGLILAFAGGALLPVPGDIALLVTFAAKPRPPPNPQPARHDHGGAPMPAAKRAKAAPVVAVAIIPVTEPRPAASVAAAGDEPTNGSAQSGPGTGGGGSGAGAGGGAGDGNGDDGGTDLRQIDGGIYENDYPREAVRAHQNGKVYIRFTVGANGRVSDCMITRSSGSPSLDETTCRLILQRFRYEPSRDAQGRPHADTVEGVHEWRMGGRMADDAEANDQ